MLLCRNEHDWQMDVQEKGYRGFGGSSGIMGWEGPIGRRRTQITLEIIPCYPYQYTHAQTPPYKSPPSSVQTWMHKSTLEKMCCFPPFVQIHLQINWHAWAHMLDHRWEKPSVALVTEQLGWVIIICELWLTLTSSGWSAMMGWHAATGLRWLKKGRMAGDVSLEEKDRQEKERHGRTGQKKNKKKQKRLFREGWGKQMQALQ